MYQTIIQFHPSLKTERLYINRHALRFIGQVGNNDSTFSGTAPDVNATAAITNAVAAANSWAMALTATTQAFEGTEAPVVVQITRAGDLTVAATLVIVAGTVAGTATVTSSIGSSRLTPAVAAASRSANPPAIWNARC